MHAWSMMIPWMNHVTYMDESCHIHELVMPHTHVVTSRVWMSHVTCMNASYHVHGWVMSQISDSRRRRQTISEVSNYLRSVQSAWDVQFVMSPHLRQAQKAPIYFRRPICIRSNLSCHTSETVAEGASLSGMSNLSQTCAICLRSPICHVTTFETVGEEGANLSGISNSSQILAKKGWNEELAKKAPIGEEGANLAKNWRRRRQFVWDLQFISDLMYLGCPNYLRSVQFVMSPHLRQVNKAPIDFKCPICPWSNLSPIRFVSDSICYVTYLRQSQKAPISDVQFVSDLMCLGCRICLRCDYPLKLAPSECSRVVLARIHWCVYSTDP